MSTVPTVTTPSSTTTTVPSSSSSSPSVQSAVTVATPPPQQFCVRWNSYQSNLQNAFPKLLTSEHFVDVTLACENEMLKCHKVVLSACSTYFEKLLLENPCQHPIIFMKDMKFVEMQSLVDFMYKGEVNVTQDELPSLLKSAEALQIRGLCGSDQLLNQSFGNLKSVTQQQQQHPKTSEKSTDKPMDKLMDKVQHHQQHQQFAELNNGDRTNPAAAATSTKSDDRTDQASSESGINPSSSDCDSNDDNPVKDELEFKEEIINQDGYYDNDNELMMMMDTEYMDEDENNCNEAKTPEYAIANVSCQYDGDGNSPGGGAGNGGCIGSNRRIRRSDEELRRAAECITRGQTFQTVSDQFNIPISTIRFYMARKGILPRRKRGRACSTSASSNSAGIAVTHGYRHRASSSSGGGGAAGGGGNTSPIGPPYHIVHYKLPPLGISKLK